MENFEDFLKETEFCDFLDTDIQKLSEEIVRNCKSDREIAVSAFYWVRDNILYRLGDWQHKASETLKEKEGTCTNKANLLVALLRCNNIPAGYGVLRVHGQEYLGPISSMFKKFIGKKSTHIYAGVYLNGKWIKCDPSDDKIFCENTCHFNPTTRIVEWDGINDAKMNFDNKYIISEEYPVANIDQIMKKRSRNAKGIQLKVSNIYVRFAREHGREAHNVIEFQSLFMQHLKKDYSPYFYLFKFGSFLKNMESFIKNGKNISR